MKKALLNLVEGGRENLENTSEFKKKADEINKEVTAKYSLVLSSERNWVKRLLLIVRREMEKSKRIDRLSSLKNLHATHG
jgi:hypothetical protein